jgi:hypothetical protein
MRNPSPWIALLLGAAALAAPACTSLLGDFTIGNGTTGTGGAGGATATTGAGGSTSTTTGTGGTSTTTTTSTGGPECDTDAQCIPLATSCAKPHCKADKTCGIIPVAAGTVIANQFTGDCKIAVCDGTGKIKVKADPSDPEDDQNPCTMDGCTGPMPTHTPAFPGLACTLPGDPKAQFCAEGAKCVECIGAMDCASAVCQGGTCVAASCMDGSKNGSETDVDCGGTCVACPTGKACGESSDCTSAHCVAGLCVDASCKDGIKNQGEANIDCGGTICAPCSAGSPCFIGTDCDSGICSANVCAPSLCDDTIQDGNETDIDCGGGTCMPCASAKSCIIDLDCLSGVCKPGFVCE